MKVDKLNLNFIRKIDKSDMLRFLVEFPEQLVDAQRLAGGFNLTQSYKEITNIVFAGMGGSAIGADILRSILFSECRLSINVIRGYKPPAYVDKNSLFFVCSYSGNTEETLSCFKEARKKKAKIISISSGGKLEELSNKINAPFIRIPQGYPPRCALGYLSIIPLFILNKLGFISDKSRDLQETISLLRRLHKDSLRPEISISKNNAKRLAKEFFGKYVIIYGVGPYLDVVITRLRGQLAENSKHLASSHTLPEMNHNEIVGWENPKNIFRNLMVLFLQDKHEQRRIEKRIEVTDYLIRREKVKTIRIYSEGKSLLARVFSLIYIGDFTSFYLALLNNTDPTPVDKVTYLKKQLAKI